jgi:hypothetical protein
MLDVTRYRLAVSYRRVWTDRLFKLGPVSCPETLVTNQQSTLHNIPEEGRSHLHHGGSLKSSFVIYLSKVLIS